MTDRNTFYCDIIANKHMLHNALPQYSHINQILDMKNTTNKWLHGPHCSSDQAVQTKYNGPLANLSFLKVSLKTQNNFQYILSPNAEKL